jgi:hypothetical protein
MKFNRNFKTGCFLKGSTPFNKGVPRVEWMGKENDKKVRETTIKHLHPNAHKIAGHNRKKVVAIKDGKLCGIFNSAAEAHRKTRIEVSSINLCCNRKRNYKTAGGYQWFFESDSTWTSLLKA